MKFLAAIAVLLLAAHVASAQTLKWTHSLTLPISIQYVKSEVSTSRSDTFGNIGLVISYSNENGFAGHRIVWLSKLGKLLHSAEFPASSGLANPTVVRVNATTLLVHFESGNQSVFRRYQLRGKTVLESDLALGTNEYFPPGGSEVLVSNDLTGFTVFGFDQAFDNITTVKRYTVK